MSLVATDKEIDDFANNPTVKSKLEWKLSNYKEAKSLFDTIMGMQV
jgi:hypothetical protein